MWKLILNIIFPKKCINCRQFGNYLCANCFSKVNYSVVFQCPVCTRPTVNGMTHPNCQKKQNLDGVIPVVVYGKIVKKLIYQLKYIPNLTVLARVIGKIMAEGLVQNESFYGQIEAKPYIIVPIPLNPKKHRARGYNHAELIAAYVAQYFNLKLNTSCLIRIKDTKPQYKLDKKQRILNIRGAFAIKKGAKVPENIILLDDIATSYSTLRECAKVLKRNGAKRVLGITFAKEA